MRTLKFEQPKKRQLQFWSDKLSKLEVKSRASGTVSIPHLNITLDVTLWKTINHLDKEKTYVALYTADPLPTHLHSNLVDTDFGLICPLCRSNEHLKLRSTLLPMTQKDEARFDPSSHGTYCEKHGLISK